MTPVSLPPPGSVAFKYGRFIADEAGKLHPARLRTIDQKLYALARDSGVAFTILGVNDLPGLSADDLAWAMMRQLRVGKFDVGNGAVVVVAPRQRQAAVAFGPGLAKEAEFSKPVPQLLAWIDQPLGNLLRVSGKITSLSAPTGINGADQRILGGPLGYTAVSMTTDDGLPLVLYVSPRTVGLQPGRRLRAGQRYTVVGRLQKRGDRKQQASGMWLFSYDPLTTA